MPNGSPITHTWGMSVLLTTSPVLDARPVAYTWQRVRLDAPPTDPLPLEAPPRPELVEPEVPPQVRSFAEALVRAVVEVIQGRRQATQLIRWVGDDALAEVELRVRRRWADEPLAVCSVHLQRTDADAVEVASRVRAGHRSSAIAMRLVRIGERWMCAAIDFGPIPPGRPQRP